MKDFNGSHNMKTIEVVAAVIIKDGEVFATQRGYGEWQGWWEFPGGKVEEGECPRAALVRKIREELDAEISVGEHLETVEWDYPKFHLTMHCFVCTLLSDSMRLKEHEAAAWLSKVTLRSVKWLPADEGILAKIENHLLSY
jgi:8-oxo-dGTP diphosphatase